MSKKNPAKKNPWRRMESWSHLKKTLVFGGLGFANLAVFGLALGVYFQSGAPGGSFYSMIEEGASAKLAGAACPDSAERGEAQGAGKSAAERCGPDRGLAESPADDGAAPPPPDFGGAESFKSFRSGKPGPGP